MWGLLSWRHTYVYETFPSSVHDPHPCPVWRTRRNRRDRSGRSTGVCEGRFATRETTVNRLTRWHPPSDTSPTTITTLIYKIFDLKFIFWTKWESWFKCTLQGEEEFLEPVSSQFPIPSTASYPDSRFWSTFPSSFPNQDRSDVCPVDLRPFRILRSSSKRKTKIWSSSGRTLFRNQILGLALRRNLSLSYKLKIYFVCRWCA